MNSSQFMDKQILGLSASGAGGGSTELFDLMDPQEDSNGGGGAGDGVLRKEEILPNYDFQPIRTVGSSSSAGALDGVGRSSWGSADPKISPPNSTRYTNILEPRERPKVSHGKDKGSYDVAVVAEIDRTVKKYADNLLHSLETVSSRLSQLESRTHNLESSLDEMKVSFGNNSGSIDGKLRQLENILREVETGVQVMRDKQEIAEAQQQLTKLQQTSSKPDHYQPPLESSNAAAPDSQQQQQQQQQTPPPSAYQPPPPPVAQPQAQPSFLTPNAPPPPLHQNPPPQYPPQLPQTQLTSLPSLPRELSYFPPPGAQPPPSQSQPQAQPPPPQRYQPPPQYSQPMPSSQSQPQAQPPQQQQYQPPPQYSQPMPSPQPLNPSPQLQPPLAHHPEESAPYMPQQSQTYPPSIQQPAPLTQPLPNSAPPQYYAPSSGQMPFPSSYALPPGPSFSDPYPYSGSPSHYNSSAMKQSPFSNSPPSPGGGGGGSNSSSSYSRLPTAKILPQAVPTGSNSSGSGGNRVPVDDVVDKVATMGFSREQVRAAVRKLTENGQSVDLNVVLDKLMNGGGEIVQPQKGWFGR